MGQLEERPQDYDDEALNFAGAEKVQGAAKLLENLEESMKGELDARAWLRVPIGDALELATRQGCTLYIKTGGLAALRSLPG